MEDRALTVLIAEDDPGHTALIERSLKRSGIPNQTRLFQDGQEILDFLLMGEVGERGEFSTPCLLLLDIRMPKVDGIEVLRQIKRDPRLKGLPVVMLSTTKDREAILRCYELGCSWYLVKPMEPGVFAFVVRALGVGPQPGDLPGAY